MAKAMKKRKRHEWKDKVRALYGLTLGRRDSAKAMGLVGVEYSEGMVKAFEDQLSDLETKFPFLVTEQSRSQDDSLKDAQRLIREQKGYVGGEGDSNFAIGHNPYA